MNCNKMKQKRGLFLALGMALLAGCSSPAPAADPVQKSEQEPTKTPEPAEHPESLVVYFSASGNTERLAQEIAVQTDSTTFVIEPEQPYTEDDLKYNDDSSRVCQQHDNVLSQEIPLVISVPEHWEEYDVIYLGYPIWWGQAAWPVSSFVQANSFEGKTVYPFCTSSSSPAGNSGESLAQLAGSGTWMPAERFSADAGEDEIRAWLETVQSAE